MELEKFDLERALAGEPVITRDGSQVTQLVKFDAPESTYTLRGVLDGDIKSWGIDGKYYAGNEDRPADLFMKPKENTIWVNVYRLSDGTLTLGNSYNTEKEAKKIKKKIKAMGHNLLKTIKIDDKID
jgi:hypothetical protein